MFDTLAMAALSPDVATALATLRTRWGAAAPRPIGEVVGSLATVPLPTEDDSLPSAPPTPRDPGTIQSTGFPALDAILGPGGLPRGMGVSLRGDLSSGRTTLALRLAAEAQASGSIVAWLDLAEAFDPVEAVARGIRPEWLVVVTPADLDEGIAIAGALLASRTVDLLVIDLPARVGPARVGPARARPAQPTGSSMGSPRATGSVGPSARAGTGVADRLGRLAALARRAGIGLAVLEPPDLTASIASAIGEATGIRLELARRSWVRLGRDVVGQETEVVVARNRLGPPGRRASLRILYADGGERDACLARDDLLRDDRLRHDSMAPIPVPGTRTDATAARVSPTPAPRPHPSPPTLRLVAGGTDRPRRPALDGRDRPRRGSQRSRARGASRDAARIGASAGAGGDVPRARSSG
jgi:RecA/RadA recombinase